MARLLVTGGAGFIGTNFVNHWHHTHPDDHVVVLDALTYAGSRGTSAPETARNADNFRFVHGDIRDQSLVEQLLLDEKLDTLVHFAAESHVDRSILGPDAFVDTNVVGTHSLLKAARAVWLERSPMPHRFHHVSTDEVYGSLGPDDPAFSETTPYAPNSPYSATKAASDHLVRAYHRTYGLSVTTSNCSNNYGPFQFPEKLIPLALIRALRGESIPIYGDGQNVRDWLYVDDHCRGIERVLLQGRTGETYNIGGGSEQTNLAVIRVLCRLLDKAFAVDPELKDRFPDAPAARGQPHDSLITFIDDRPGHDRRYAIDGSKITRELGYSAQETFESGLEKTVTWYLDHEPWWQKILDSRYQNWIAKRYGTA